MQECGRLGTGQTASGEDMSKAWARLQFMLQQWQQKRWLVYHLVTYTIVSTGATSYTFGPGGEINTNQASAWQLTELGVLSGSEGSGYAPGDILTLAANPASGNPTTAQLVQVLTADSSGGITSIQTDVAAIGSIQFFANPIASETITLNGTTWTFVAAGATGNQTNIQATADLTLAQLVTDLNASTNAVISTASYSVTGTLAATTLKLQVLFDTTGTLGNSFTLAASTATVSGTTLTSGLDNATSYPGPLPNTWSINSSTGTGFNAVLGFPTWTKVTSIATVSGSQRPAKVESAFLRQIQVSGSNQVDYPLRILQAHEDYDKIGLKTLQGFSGTVFLDSDFPLGNVFCNPVPNSGQYSINLTVKQPLQTQFASYATAINLPEEYYAAIMYNLAIRLRPTFQIPTFPGDPLPGLANDALAVVRGPNTQIASLVMPAQLTRPGVYNIFSDQNY